MHTGVRKHVVGVFLRADELSQDDTGLRRPGDLAGLQARRVCVSVCVCVCVCVSVWGGSVQGLAGSTAAGGEGGGCTGERGGTEDMMPRCTARWAG